MAYYEHLPIYPREGAASCRKKAYDLALYFEKIVRNFSRYHKYTPGTELREKSREILQLNSTPEVFREADKITSRF